MRPNCRLCGAEVLSFARQRVLGKYDVDYMRCPTCDLIQTEKPYWLAEAYSHAISHLDTGAVQRNERDSRITAAIARILAVRTTCLDYGGGHGVLVRMMRDLGFDFRWFDAYANNIFARGFEADIKGQYALVTAFEVFEHLDDVRGELEQLFGAGPDYVLVGTALHSGHQPGWFYYALESGQHISFYSRSTLSWIARRFDYEVVAAESWYSLFARSEIAPKLLRRSLIRRLLKHIRLASYLPRPLVQLPTLVHADHELMRGRADG